MRGTGSFRKSDGGLGQNARLALWEPLWRISSILFGSNLAEECLSLGAVLSEAQALPTAAGQALKTATWWSPELGRGAVAAGVLLSQLPTLASGSSAAAAKASAEELMNLVRLAMRNLSSAGGESDSGVTNVARHMSRTVVDTLNMDQLADIARNAEFTCTGVERLASEYPVAGETVEKVSQVFERALLTALGDGTEVNNDRPARSAGAPDCVIYGFLSAFTVVLVFSRVFALRDHYYESARMEIESKAIENARKIRHIFQREFELKARQHITARLAAEPEAPTNGF